MSGEILLFSPRSEYRVIEVGTPDHRTMAIRKVSLDVDGKPLKYAATSPKIESSDGDGLLVLLNDVAMALTKPSLLLEDFE